MYYFLILVLIIFYHGAENINCFRHIYTIKYYCFKWYGFVVKVKLIAMIRSIFRKIKVLLLNLLLLIFLSRKYKTISL